MYPTLDSPVTEAAVRLKGRDPLHNLAIRTRSTLSRSSIRHLRAVGNKGADPVGPPVIASRIAAPRATYPAVTSDPIARYWQA